MGWDEILEGGAPPGAIVQVWRDREYAVRAVRSGHQVIVSPLSHVYLNDPLTAIDLRKAYAYDPMPGALAAEQQRLVLGGEFPMWTEHAPQSAVEAKVFPRGIAIAERLWSGTGHAFSDLRERLGGHYRRLDALGIAYGAEEAG